MDESKVKETDFYIPLDKDWYWFVVRYINEVLKPGEKKMVWDKDEPGWFYWALVSSNNPLILFNIDLVSIPSMVEIRVSPYNLYTWGLNESIAGFRVLKYDAVSNIYTVEYAPGVLGFIGTPFRERNRAWLENPTNTDITFTLQAWLILFKNKGEEYGG